MMLCNLKFTNTAFACEASTEKWVSWLSLHNVTSYTAEISLISCCFTAILQLMPAFHIRESISNTFISE